MTLGLTGEGGTESNPWPIYNVWQLQAIDGVSVSDARVTLEGLTLFGADASARLGAHYRLALDIDATPTKEWDGGKGFSPIAGTDTGGRAGTTQRSPHLQAVLTAAAMRCAGCSSTALTMNIPVFSLKLTAARDNRFGGGRSGDSR